MTVESTAWGYDLVTSETSPGDASKHDASKLWPTDEAQWAILVDASPPVLGAMATVSQPMDNTSFSATK